MIIRIIPRVGEPPITLDAAQFVVYNAFGTPISVGAEYGPQNTQAVSTVDSPDFGRILRMLGISTTVVVDTLQLPKPPPGARLLAGPKA